ncbi:DNA-dependent metalloprotease WSS1-like isoform X2 [Magnolia sinica]|uniref:DNA-dependent metalloprotease WSS1-like isoform X2 n=1 Tax=Magnolia sinica TaxID=86752 RepID=UPI00265AC988|nr:DNA-dependent metalloprotease WSS1-like isoform X2 [Magnolia sinica]
MDLNDLNKVWEIKALKKPGEDEALKILQRIAKQVQPIMKKHRWTVKILSEFCPANPSLLGLNVNGGAQVKLRLRKHNREWEFFPYEQVLDTMLHELCHNVHGPHNALFYKLWDDIRKECDELIAKGITGTGQGFDTLGRRVGGFSRQPPLSSLRESALAAAEKRARLGTLLPSGPKRLGGDSNIMAALSPIQAAAMAAERRMQDDLWCGSVSSGTSSAVENETGIPGVMTPRGLAAGSKDSIVVVSDTDVICLDDDGVCSSKVGSDSKDGSMSSSTSGSIRSHRATDGIEDKANWECNMCTLLNQYAVYMEAALGVLRARFPKLEADKIFW